ncbi:beta-lactamase/transpeptidase-like protein [Thozetella sp. PMI_491]|nr:beta-lactamase/transpeptidase-like protein [Thozetella sp. PMI_491]
MASQSLFTALLIFLSFYHTLALKYCPPRGPILPLPVNIANHPIGISATDGLEKAFREAVQNWDINGNKFDPGAVSFSVNVGSINDNSGNPIFEYHHTASPSSLNSSSTTNVTGESIYRIGSVSKVFIPYALLIARGRVILNELVIDYIPELYDIALEQEKSGLGEVEQVAWKEVTIGALASHMSGLGESFAPLDLSAVLPDPTVIGLPNLNQSDVVTCGGYEGQPPCTKEFLLRSIIERHPVHHTFATPGYSNPGIILLGYVLEKVTGKPWPMAIEDLIFKPLNLSNTGYNLPTTISSGVIPAGQLWWSTDLGDVSITGGIYASTDDMALFARSVLNSALLSAWETRAWLQPMAHTSDPFFSIGSPWEIRRVNANSTGDGHIIDIYTKDGSLETYYSKVVLLPDFGVTIAINVAGDSAVTVIKFLAELVVSTYVPALEAITKDQAAQRYRGVYTSPESNSSMTIEIDGGPGLAITSWINNGMDVLDVTIPTIGHSPVLGHPRMYATGLRSTSPQSSTDHEITMVGFHVIFTLESMNDGLSIFTDACGDWGLLDVVSYGKVGLDDVVFYEDKDGVVLDMDLRGLRKVLKKV